MLKAKRSAIKIKWNSQAIAKDFERLQVIFFIAYLQQRGWDSTHTSSSEPLKCTRGEHNTHVVDLG